MDLDVESKPALLSLVSGKREGCVIPVNGPEESNMKDEMWDGCGHRAWLKVCLELLMRMRLSCPLKLLVYVALRVL